MQAKQLKEIVSKFKKVVNKQNTMPILDNIKNVDGKMTATNLHTTLTSFKGFDGQFCFSFFFLDKILSKAKPTSDINIFAKDEEVIITINNDATFKTKKVIVEDYPKDILPVMPNNIGALNADTIEKIKSASKFTGKDDLRPIFFNVFVEKKIVATDAHRMIYLPYDNILQESILVPKEVCNLLNSEEYKVTKDVTNIILLSESEQIQYRYDNVSKFPNYEAVIPQNNNISYEVNVKELIENIELAKIAANPITKLIKLSFSDSKLTISSEDKDMETKFENGMDVHNVMQGEIEMGFHADYFIEMLKECEFSITTMSMSLPNRAMVFDNNKLLMPAMLYK